ncbi:MAG TPA: hydrogenase maturation nickel metallochaperone HypA [Candidatus Hydrogenedentes bacterium]|nr:hydrogenase maturation nickel metallochaperone HypA [Candidatus Hydrogenedentota bacterium]
MHEVGIVKRILEMAIEVSLQHEGRPIDRVCVSVGTLRQVVPESMRFAFEAVSRGTRAEGAVFDLCEVQAEVICANCETRFHPDAAMWVCPACAAGGGRVVKGDELILTSVTLRCDNE